MMEDKLVNKLLQNRPHLLERYNSKQYEWSKQILYWKHKHHFSANRMAKLVNLPLQTYLQFEGGYTEHPVEDYKKLLAQLAIHDYLENSLSKTKHQFVHSTKSKVEILSSLSTHQMNLHSLFQENAGKQKSKREEKPSFHFSDTPTTITAHYPSQLLDAAQQIPKLSEECTFVYQ